MFDFYTFGSIAMAAGSLVVLFKNDLGSLWLRVQRSMERRRRYVQLLDDRGKAVR